MRIGIIAAAVVAVMASSSAIANPGVEARQQLMKSIVGNVKAIGGYVKGQNDEGPSNVGSRAASIAADAARIGGAFGDQVHVENANGVKTTAAPAIWEKWGDFVKIAADLEGAAITLAGVAASGDKAQIGASFGAMTKTCGACHKPFRIKK